MAKPQKHVPFRDERLNYLAYKENTDMRTSNPCFFCFDQQFHEFTVEVQVFVQFSNAVAIFMVFRDIVV